MLEHVGDQAIVHATSVRGPEIAQLESDEVQALGRLAVPAVRTRLGVEEAIVYSFDRADLPLQIARRSVMTLVCAGGNAHRVTWSEAHRLNLSSSSPDASTPFSVRIVSAAKSQRS